MADDSDDAWGQLVCTSDVFSDPILIKKDIFVLGRSKGADISLIGNKLVSGSHCSIQRDKSGIVWIEDTSSNGTLLNYKQKLQKQKKQLHHGDEFHLVYKKDEEHLNISYMYQDLAKLKEEEDEANETADYSLSADDTSATLPLDDECSSPENRKRSRSPEVPKVADEAENENKKRKTDVTSSSDVKDTNSKSDGAGKSKSEDKKSDVKDKPEKDKKSTEGMEENMICIICQEILHDCISCQPCMHSFCGGCYSDWMKRSQECPACRMEVVRVNKNHIVNNLVEVYLKEHPDRRRPQDEIDELNKRNKISEDMLKPPPPKKTMSEYIDDEGDDDDDDEEDDDYVPPSSGLVTVSPFSTAVAPGGGYFFSGMTGFGGAVLRPPKTVCRQCPDYKEDGSGTGGVASAAASAVGGAVSTVIGMFTGSDGSTSTSAGPSTSTSDGPVTSTDGKVMPTAPDFTCKTDGQIHIMCQCCLKPMPDRRTERTANEDIPHQQCSLCYRMYCHMYWGCKKDECLGCLGRFKNMNFGDKVLFMLVLENTYESEILKDYMKKNDITLQELLGECCKRLDSGDYTCVDQVRGLTPNTVTCYPCGLRNFRDLAYQYRKDIPNDDLSPAARSRPYCYWGKNCRTQRGKMGHAAKYNHICDQSRT